MSGYYDLLANGGGRAEALRQAALARRRRPGYGHPYYWASFIVSGDGSSLAGKLTPPPRRTRPPPLPPRRPDRAGARAPRPATPQAPRAPPYSS
jgi:hypothetical protein